MKTLKHLLTITYLGCLIAVTGCEAPDLDTDDLQMSLNLDIFKTLVDINFYDANTKEPIGFNDNTQIALNILGQDKNLAVDFDGNILHSMEATDHMMFYIDPYTKEVTGEDPIRMHLAIEADGYLSTTHNVIITHEGPKFYEVYLFKKEDPGAGVVVYDLKEDAVSNGVVAVDTEIKTDHEEVIMEITGGTQLLTKDGEPLEGELSIEVAYFNPQEPGVEEAFPGGSEPTVSLADGTVQDGSFISISFASIVITDEQGRRAENFSQEVALQLAIPEGSMNPDTGEEIKAGDIVPLWSYNDETGVWKWEEDVVVGPEMKSDGRLVAKAMIKHLSWWNLDFFWNSCRYGIWVDVQGRSKCDPCLYFGLEITRNGSVIRRKVGRICDETIKFYLAPQGTGGVLVAYMNYWDWYYKRNEIGRTTITNLCDQVPYPNNSNANRTSITVTTPTSDFHKIFRFIGVCPGRDDVEVRPSLPAYYGVPRGSDDTYKTIRYSYLGWIRNGEIELCNLQPGTYWFKFDYRGESHYWHVTINADYTLTLDYDETIIVTQSGIHVIYTINLPKTTCDEL